MLRMPRLLLLTLLAAGALSGCGELSRPFAGNPGATARRLSRPPPALLAVPVPTEALLADAAGATLAGALATALQAQEVPAVAESPHPVDWRLITGAELRGGEVVPLFTVQNPAGENQGATEGAGVPAAAWSEGTAQTMRSVAESAAPKIASLLTRIEAALAQSDPNSLVNRPARVFFKGVHGAPGDGNTALARQISTQLPGLGPVVQDSAAGADFVLDGEVTTSPLAGKQTQVEIEWRVNDAAGHECGRVAQLNEVPAGSLDHYWGEVAVAVAQEAAAGIRDVILNQSGARHPGS